MQPPWGRLVINRTPAPAAPSLGVLGSCQKPVVLWWAGHRLVGCGASDRGRACAVVVCWTAVVPNGKNGAAVGRIDAVA
jgi:hypothetical protein